MISSRMPSTSSRVCSWPRRQLTLLLKHLLNSAADTRSFLRLTRRILVRSRKSRMTSQARSWSQETVLQQLRNPFGIFLVGLCALAHS